MRRVAALALISACNGSGSPGTQPSLEEICPALNGQMVVIEGAGDLAPYAGLAEIEANLYIAGGELQDLSQLAALTELHGDLTIVSPSMRSLAGLENLAHIDGTLTLAGPRIESTNALASLESVCSGMIGGDSLEDLSLPVLRAANTIWVREARSLERIGMPALEQVYERFEISKNAALNTVELPALHEVHIFEVFQDETELTTFDLSALRIGHTVNFIVLVGDLSLDLEIAENSLQISGPRGALHLDSLESVDTLNVATSTSGSISVAVLESVLQSLSVRGGTASFPALETIGFGAHLTARVLQFPALVREMSGEGTVYIEAESVEMGALESMLKLNLKGTSSATISLPILQAGTVTIFQGRFLFPNLQTMSNLEMVPDAPICVPGSFRGEGPVGVALPSLQTLGSVRARCLPIDAIQAPALTTIEGDLAIRETEVLAGLHGLSSLERIGGSLILSENDQLSGLGLDSLTSVGQSVSPSDAFVRVIANPVLRDCEAAALVAQLIDFDGTVTIEMNGTGSCP